MADEKRLRLLRGSFEGLTHDVDSLYYDICILLAISQEHEQQIRVHLETAQEHIGHIIDIVEQLTEEVGE